jgi:hypothetical protein
MTTKLESFLKSNKIDPRRLVAVSRLLERLRPEDRAIKLTQRQARKSEEGTKPEGLAKPRSGRPVTAVSIDKALAGKPISGPQKTRILRAVNRVLELRKKPPVELGALFDAPKAGTKNKKKKEEE